MSVIPLPEMGTSLILAFQNMCSFILIIASEKLNTQTQLNASCHAS